MIFTRAGSGRESVPEVPPAWDAPEYAIRLANYSYNWYRNRAIACRRAYKRSEVALLLVTALVPLSSVVFQETPYVTASLGSAAVVLAGLRPIFHWQENFLRFSQAREAVEGERRKYALRAHPYEKDTDRDQTLVSAISEIEQQEMNTWFRVATPRPSDSSKVT
jgi:hypothetical protein